MLNRNVVAMAAAAMGLAASAAVTLEVAPGGELTTPRAAVEKVRALRTAGTLAADEQTVIRLSKGVYPLEEKLTLGAADHDLRFVGEPGAVLSGGVRLGRFTAGADGIWRVKLEDGRYFEQLWVNGRRATLAKSPNERYHYIRQTIPGIGKRGMYVHKEDLAPLAKLSKEELGRVIFRIWWSWERESNRIARMDADKGTVELEKDFLYDIFRWRSQGKETRYTLENYREALDAPGEFFIEKGELLYIPREGECAETAVAVAPRLEQLAVIDGARNVRFEGVSFAHTSWIEPRRHTPYQAAVYVTSADIEVRNASGVVFDRCVFEHLSKYAVWFRRGAEDCAVTRSVIRDGGAGGISVGLYEGEWRQTKDDPREPKRITVDNNFIHDLGHVFPEGCGIFMNIASDCRFTHNEICDLYYTGISVGLDWTFAEEKPTHGTLVAYNHVHHIGKCTLSDMGGIYTLGVDRGSRVMCNIIHDISQYGYTGHGAVGMYQDLGSSYRSFESNLIYRAGSGISTHRGKENRFVNNIVIASDREEATALANVRYEKWTSMICSNNVFCANAKSDAFNRFGPGGGEDAWADLVFGSNLWWCPGGFKEKAFNGESFEAWRAHGKDEGSVVADPLFVDAAHDDYRLRPDSPARAIGYREWDFSECGVYGDADWVKSVRAVADALKPFDPPPEPPEYRPFLTEVDFERYRPGEQPQHPLKFRGEAPVASADAAYGGKLGMKVGEKCEFLELYQPSASTKYVTFAYMLKVGEGAKFYHGWREWKPNCKNGKYVEGFFVTFGDGEVALKGDGVVEKLPIGLKPGEWVKMMVAVKVGRNGERTRAVVTIENAAGEKAATKPVPTDPDFIVPNWSAFFPTKGEFFLDDLRYEMRY